MNSHKTAILLITSLIALVACTQNSNPDACTVDKPPKDSYVFELPHAMGNSYTYPNIENSSSNYTGCVKVWHDDKLVFFFRLKDGVVMHVETMELGEGKVTCEFDTERKLLQGPADKCVRFSQFPVSK